MASVSQVLPVSSRRARASIAGGRASVREVYFTKRINNSHVVRELDVSQLRACFTLAIPLGLTFALLFAFAWLHFQCVRYGYEIGDQRRQQAALSERNRELRAQEESALQQVAPTAQLELGMDPVSPGQVIHVTQAVDGLPGSEEPQLAEARPAPRPPVLRSRR